MSVIHKPPMQGHTAAASINGSPVPSPHSIDYSQPTIATGRISTYELPTENSIPEEQGEEMSSIAIPYYTTVEPLSVGSSSHDSISSASPSSDSVASGHAVHVTVLQSSGLSDTGSDPANLCVPSSQSDSGSSSTVKHWTYEEQFKQLYNMSPEPERKAFLDKLFDFMQRKGTPITRIPIMAKQPLDLYRLFKLVVERGGLVEVIKKKAWRNVAKELNLPASITSAAFTMRSQYVKYLYPYECEVEKLSDPQELQLAIDSNKRDRRHSETVEFIAPQITTCRPVDMEQDLSSQITHVTTPKGLQLIGSPTVALPHGSVPPYTGGFIVTPTGTHVMAPPGVSRGQLLHMAPHGIPIVMQAPVAAATGKEPSEAGSNEDGEESHESADGSEPPPKKIGLDPSQAKVAMGNSPLLANLPPHTASFLLAPPGGGPLVQVPHGLTSHGPQLIQMAPQPFMVPTTAGSCSPTEGWSSRDNERMRLIQQAPVVTRENHSVENNVSIATISPQSLSGMVIAPGPRGAYVHSPRLVQVSTTHRPCVPVMMSSSQGTHSSGERLERRRFEQLVMAGERGVAEEAETKPVIDKTSLSSKIPFANISIQSTDSKDSGDKATDSSLLVTLELNHTVYQGVLFAKPSSGSSPPR